jgi:carbonic anhydrase
MDMEGALDVLVERNARRQAGEIRARSSVVREAEEAGRTSVVAAVFDIASGEVRLLD